MMPSDFAWLFCVGEASSQTFAPLEAPREVCVEAGRSRAGTVAGGGSRSRRGHGQGQGQGQGHGHGHGVRGTDGQGQEHGHRPSTDEVGCRHKALLLAHAW